MPKERVLKLGVVAFPYGGNGATSSEVPDLRHWMSRLMRYIPTDPRIDPDVWVQDYSDTPIPMTRNRAVLDARAEGVDVLVMLDSDMRPDCELGRDPEAKPWFPTSFDFVYKHWDKGPSVVCAPYCGPPPHENVYVFHWAVLENDGQNITHKLEMYSREQAAVMSGIQPVGAQPTGQIMFDMRAFDLTDPSRQFERLIKDGVPREKAKQLTNSWFYYEWNDFYAADKGSTEDVTATRDISMVGMTELGYSPIYCNWDAWAGHWKPKCVGKPRVVFVDQIGQKYQQAVIDNLKSNHRRQFVNFKTEPEKPTLKFDTTETIVDSPYLGQPPETGSRTSKVELAFDVSPSGVATARYENGVKVDPRDDGVIRVGGMYTPSVDLDALEKLAAMVAGETKYRPMFLEVGSWVGETALAMSRGAPEAVITCVDTWKGTPDDPTSAIVAEHGGSAVFDAFLKNTSGKSIHAIDGESVATAKSWGPSATPRDLIFIDAEHTYEALKADIEAWWSHLKDGGVMAFHDYRTPMFPGVTQAIHERFGEDAVHWDGMASVCWVRKDAKAT